MKTSFILLLILGVSFVISKTYAQDTLLGSKPVGFGRKVEGGGKIIKDGLVKDSEKKRGNPVSNYATTVSDDEGSTNDDDDNNAGEDGRPSGSSTDTHRQINFDDFSKLFHHRPNPEP